MIVMMMMMVMVMVMVMVANTDLLCGDVNNLAGVDRVHMFRTYA